MTVSQHNKKHSSARYGSSNSKQSTKFVAAQIHEKHSKANNLISVRFREVRSEFSLTQSNMARVLGISTRKLSELETSVRQPRPETKRRLIETERLYKALTEIMDASDLSEWLREPLDAFGSATPLELIERGEIDRLWQMIYAVRTGHPT